MSSEARRLADRYVLDAPIGRGGMGEVWRATDTVLGRAVAVKTIDLRRMPDDAGAARFEREARVTAGMSHPNVVTVHDTGVEGHTAYLVMELLPGPSLAERLRDEGPLPVEEVVDVARQVASALEAAHSRGLVHRDIKPANIAYAADGRLKVLDFGITQLGEAAGSQALTATHTVMGTAEYLAPEQAMGGRVDGRADLYALGCVLFALLTGRPPFSGPTAVATMMLHTSEPVPDVREARPDTPAWLAALVAGLLAKSPEDRPDRAAAVLESLDARRAPAGSPDATTVLPVAGAGTTQPLDTTQRLDTARSPVPPPPPAAPPPGSTAGSRPVAAPPRRRGGSSVAMWLLVVIALAALGVLLWQLLGGSQGTAEPTGTPTTSSSAPAPTTATSAPEPSTTAPSPTPTPTPTTADPAPVQDAASALDGEAKALQQDGVIDKDAATIVQDPLKEADKALRAEDAGALTSARDTLVDGYRQAVADGTYPPEAAQRLDPLVQDFSDAVDAYAAG